MSKFYYPLIIFVLCSLVSNAQRATCPEDTIVYTFEKATGIDTLTFEPQITSAAYQYFDAPQAVNVRGARFYGFKPDTAGGNTVTITVELRRATADSVPGSSLLASGTHTLTIPDSFNGPMSAYAVVVTWSQVQVDQPFTIVVKTGSDAGNPGFSIFHNRLSGSTPDGDQEWLGGVLQGTSWIRSYAYLPYGNPFDADFIIQPIVQYNLNASFINDPECLFDELGEDVSFQNDGSKIADNKFYNRLAFYSQADRQRWNYGDGTPVDFTPNPVHFYPTNGPFVASFTAKILTWSQDLCQSSVTQIIKEKPAQDFSYTTSNLDVNFTNETFGLFSDIYYDFGDGNYSLSENPNHKFAAPGTYWVCQTMNTSCGEITLCKNVAVATNTALNCGKDSVRYTTARATEVKNIRLKTSTPRRLLGVGQIFDANQSMIVHGFTFYGNHEGLFRDSYPVLCRIYKKGGNKLPDGEAISQSLVHINKVDVDTNYSDSVRYTAIFSQPVNLSYDYILTIEFIDTLPPEVPIQIGTSDWIDHDGDGDLLAIGKINDTTWVTAASVAVFNVDGVAFDADIIIEPLVEYNLDANFTWNFGCLDMDEQPVTFTDSSTVIVRDKIYNTIPFYTSSVQAYEWDFDDGTGLLSLINPSHTFLGSGPYDVSLTITMDGWTNDCSSTQIKTIYVEPTGGFSYEQVTSAVQFIDSAKNADAYWWTFEDNTYSSLSNPIHYFTSVGTFEVCQYVSNECGSDTTCVDITINVVGIPESYNSDFTIYPNPAVDMINVRADLSVMKSISLTLQDMSGRTVRQLILDDSTEITSMPVSDLARGTYLLKIKAGDYEGTRKVLLLD